MNNFWAKTNADGAPGISVIEHLMNVGCVARSIAEITPALLERFGIRAAEVGALASLHDLGKISPGFQRKCQIWLEENGLAKISRNCCWDTGMEPDHGKVSHSAIQDFLMHQDVSRSTAMYLATILGAHHGRIKFFPNDRGIKPPLIKSITDSKSGINWDNERQECALQLWKHFNPTKFVPSLSDESPALWWLAGLTSVADWIGSDERFFSPDTTAEINPDTVVMKALDVIGFQRNEPVPNLSFHDLFHDAEKPDNHWTPNEMQNRTFATVSGSGVYVIEAPMGMGKTEAALWAAYKLLVSGKATGIYFALPTQATSNRMHIRMNEFVRRISSTHNASQLIHGNSWLMDQAAALSPVATSPDSKNNDAQTGRNWFASAKRALLAAFGVGTVDQALLGVVAAKHFFVRHFALAGKVVILDEIHSYDLYTGTLIDKLITTLEGLGCTVIVLSATLTGKRREQIVSYSDNIPDVEHLPYPLISGRIDGEPFEPIAAMQPESRLINVDFLSMTDAEDEAIKLANKGGSVLWICNTVGAAQKQYQKLMDLTDRKFSVGLIHSRFPFWRRENLEDKWMARFGKDGTFRCASILVSTQIVEQSVDLDADLLITELAPTDMLLQRLGRLWRHSRKNRPVEHPRMCIIKEEKSIEELQRMDAKAIVQALGKKAKVYAPFVLLRSLEVWEGVPSQQVLIPFQIRELIESTYVDRWETEPESWQNLYNEWSGSDSAKKMIASRNSNIWQLAMEDREGVQTRINEMPTVPMVLCLKINKQEAVFIDGTSGNLGGEKFLFHTAQAIHKNLVKVPKYCFDHIEICPAFVDYLYGEQCVGLVSATGSIEVNGLKEGFHLLYIDKLGLVVEQTSA